MCRARAIRCRSARGAGCARARTACSARSRSCRGGRGGSAGLRPAPAVVPAAGRQPQKQQRAFRGMAGRCRVGLRGRREPVPGGLAAASIPRTPPQPDPPRLRQFPAAVGGC
ncbi:hypothetical protein D7Y26_00395 [Stenotrophomonas maltophilia]|nr:hypothetical protein [Stenotrophomonas maltophilia]MBA0322089.1 hypothetical protein [Stenotrophomonas maltophilia]